MTNHLWQSTLFALAVALLAPGFRRNRAEVRYWLWFSASLKFLTPFALLASLGALMPAPASHPIAPAAVATAVEQVVTPFSGSLAAVSAAPRSIDWIPILWGCGFAAVAAIRFRDWRRLRGPTSMPAVIGFWRPALVLPPGIEERLTPAQLDAVVAHEMCHVRRRDNLFAAIHMVVEAIFWFHPLVWWIGARLVAERERACDEEVLRQGGDPGTYAEAIVSVCKYYVESPLACVAGITGGDLKKRIEAIMQNTIGDNLSAAKKILLLAATAFILAAPIAIGIHAQTTPKFEVASIKLCKPGEGAGRGAAMREESPDRLNVTCQTLAQLIRQAYGKAPISGGPDWIDSDRFWIEAKAAAPETRETLTGPMLRALLEERFRLRVHRENKEVPVYFLTVAKGGLKIAPATQPCLSDPTKIEAAVGAGEKPRSCGIFFGRSKGTGLFTLNTRGVTLSALAGDLSSALDRPVVDKTDVAGTFDLKVEFAPDETTAALRGKKFFQPAEGTASEPGPSIVMALEKEAGLKLEPGKGGHEFLAIDRVEKLAEN